MTDPGSTTYENKVAIMADLWTNYREEDAFSELFEYADLSFPLAFALFHNMIDTTDSVEKVVSEAFALLLDVLGVEDVAFEKLDTLLAFSENQSKED
jgi:hypothetical protein